MCCCAQNVREQNSKAVASDHVAPLLPPADYHHFYCCLLLLLRLGRDDDGAAVLAVADDRLAREAPVGGLLLGMEMEGR